MTCALGHETRHFTGTKAFPVDRHSCPTCKRDYSAKLDRWTRHPGYCDGCQGPTWRMRDTPEFGKILLWPDPATKFPRFRTPNGPGADIFRDFCATCCPRVGDDPPAIIAEIDGQPIETAECVGYMPADRYAHLFNDKFGRFLHDWLVDHLGLSAEERDAVLGQWDQDRAEVNTNGG